jgi:adenylosuccinate synthase
VVGLQWGDEAKGKLVDLLTADFDMVVRYQGGANAGHTVVVGDNKYKLHHIPSGILNPKVKNLITAGVVLNPQTILEEIDELTKRGIQVEQTLIISDRAHVVMPWHLDEDCLMNQTVVGQNENIGTTLRGIGPCYRDKVGRNYALRLGDFYRPDFRERVTRIIEVKNRMLSSMSGGQHKALNVATICDEYTRYTERLRPFVCDTTAYLLDAIDADKAVLFEGAQGALLDIDHGTYPFVTSSNSSGVGVFAGAGIPARFMKRMIGVVKAYSTRVGGGPFPTEQCNEFGNHLRGRGREYGTTTGRPRRCGWFDAVATRYTARLSGVDMLSLMMLDVLSELAEIKICVAYEIDGRRVDRFPSHVDELRAAQPIYESLPGWRDDISGAEKLEELPANARTYIDRVAELVGCAVGIVSVGPDRRQTIFMTRS